jgi:hypothetical protein
MNKKSKNKKNNTIVLTEKQMEDIVETFCHLREARHELEITVTLTNNLNANKVDVMFDGLCPNCKHIIY